MNPPPAPGNAGLPPGLGPEKAERELGAPEISTGYKQTEVGVIPENWDCSRIRDAASRAPNSIVGGPFGSDLVSADYVKMGTPVIRGQNMSPLFVSGEFVFVSDKKAKDLSANLARAEDLVFTQRGTLGQVSIVPNGGSQHYLISQSQMKVSLDRSKYDPRFLHHFFLSSGGQKQIITSAIQTGVPHTNLGILRDYRFPAPPLPEQRAIAEALSDVDGLLGAQDRLIAKKRDLKQAAMQQLLTAQTRLPGFSGEWEVKRLGDVAQLYQAQTIGQSVFTDDGYPVYGANGIIGRYSQFNHSTPQITISCRGNCGTINRTEQFSWITGNAMVVNLDKNKSVNPEFMFQILSAQDFSILVTGSGQPQIVRGPLAEFPLQIPCDLPEQTAIAAVLSEMDAELATLEQRREKTRALKQAMMQELLTGRTRLL